METPITSEPEYVTLNNPPLCFTCGQPCIVCPNCGFSWCPRVGTKIENVYNCECCGTCFYH